MFRKKLIPLFILGGLALFLLAGLVVQQLWNATISDIFSIGEISYKQGILILLLCKILFGSHYRVHKQHRTVSKLQPEINSDPE